MKRLPGLLSALIFVAGCVPASAPGSTSPSVSPDATDQQEKSDTPATTTTTLALGSPVGWITPSGVPVGVTEVNGETIEILTPCGNPGVITEGSPIHEVDVLIDPGHGGPIDTGAVGATGIQEKEINLEIGLALHDLLADRGVDAMLTRTADYPIPIRVRTSYSDLIGAEAVVSIHHNAPEAPASDIPGVEIFVQNESSESARLGGLLYDASIAALSQFDIQWQRAPDAGVMTVLNSEGEDAYGMVRLPEAPSSLVELGYIANPSEAELYSNPAYVPAVAEAIADAVERFLTTEEIGSPLVDGRDFDPRAGVGRDQCIEPHLERNLFPDVIDVNVTRVGTAYDFVVTVSSPYDSAERYADAWRVVGDDGEVYGVRELLHDHAAEQPFTRRLEGVQIPDTVESVTVEGRDQVYGWGGETVEISLP